MHFRPTSRNLPQLILVGLLLSFSVDRTFAEPQQQSAEVAKNSSPPESFEESPAGVFQELTTSVGVWAPEAGKTIIDNKHAKTGKQCLQLTGGKETTVTLQIADGVDTTGNLTFWAERWTRNRPFSFRIEKRTDQGWREIYNGDSTVRVGRAFLSQVRIPLDDESIKQLRFKVTSPENTGILIDDLHIRPAQPQKIVGVEVTPLTLPALVGKEACPLLRLKIETLGQLQPISLTNLTASLLGDTDPSDVASLQVFHVAGASTFSTQSSVAQVDHLPSDKKPFTLTCAGDGCPLTEGANYIWIACKLKDTANIDRHVGVVCSQVAFSSGHVEKLPSTPSIQRMGIAVRHRGYDGVHTYRIPGLATTNKGTLIGVYDVRHRGGGDLPGDIDVGMSRSTDGGRTWEPMRVIMDLGDDPQWRYDGVGDPAILVDRNTGAIWVAATWSHGNRSWRGSGPGLSPEETGQLMLVRSDDDGVTWSKPINITKQVKKPEWCFLLQGPGKGITMRDGTIVFAAQYQDPPDKNRLPHSTIIYSKDHGETWQVGTGAYDDTTESQVVELEPGVLMLNCRYNRKAARVVIISRDLGKNWQPHATTQKSLIEPGSCMASLIDLAQEGAKELPGWLLFSNPDSTRGRHHITIKASPDLGETWPKEHRMLLDEGNGAGYSCMSLIDDQTVGILYEGSQAHMTFQRIPLNELVRSKKQQPPPPKASQQSLKLPQVFGSHMVLQADAELPIWGEAGPNAPVHVSLGTERISTTADRQGKWSVRLKPRAASATPLTMRVESAGKQIEFTDILMGEVWVCAGQSNMEWMLSQSEHGADELASADRPQIRLLHLQGGVRGGNAVYGEEELARLTHATFCQGDWQVASAASAQRFSAVGWYFGRKLQQDLQVPIGLICPAVGGTPTEAWISREALAADPKMKAMVTGNWLDNERLGDFCRNRGFQNLLSAIQAGESLPGDDQGPNHSFKPGFMWSAGVEPIIPYAIRGVIWYQGESNAETAARVVEHNHLFPLLITQWRKRWGQGDFPFLYVQLPALNRSEWPAFREGQRRMLDQLKQVGMAITIDTGHPSNVHPTLKHPVGDRLARLALGTTYSHTGFATYSGPLFSSVKRQKSELIVSFNQAGTGLKTSDGKPPGHFELCGADGVFHPANAKIVDQSVIALSSDQVAKPIHARYAWSPYPQPAVNLFNSEELPASPFSTE